MIDKNELDRMKDELVKNSAEITQEIMKMAEFIRQIGHVPDSIRDEAMAMGFIKVLNDATSIIKDYQRYIKALESREAEEL